MKPTKTLVLIHSLFALHVIVSVAQQVTPGTGRISTIEGKVYLNEQRVEPSPDPVYILGNSIVRTEEGRAEVRLAGGVSLFLGENSAFKFIPTDNSFNRLELLKGSAVIATGDMGSVVRCENGVTLSDSGLYRFDVLKALPELDQKFCRFKIYEGAAAVQLTTAISVLRRGNATTLSLACGDHVGFWTFDLEEIDTLDNWSREQIRLRRVQ